MENANNFQGEKENVRPKGFKSNNQTNQDRHPLSNLQPVPFRQIRDSAIPVRHHENLSESCWKLCNVNSSSINSLQSGTERVPTRHLHDFYNKKPEDSLSLKNNQTSGKKEPQGVVRQQKVNLVRKLSCRGCNRRAVESTFSFSLYNAEEYLEVSFQQNLITQNKYILQKTLLPKIKLNESIRSQIVNWLVIIQQQNNLLESSLFAAVRIFDWILMADDSLHPDYFGLVGLTSLWISTKYYDNKTFTVTQLLSYCNGCYNRNQILKMERHILRILEFCVNFPEPLGFLEFYLHKIKLNLNHYVCLATTYILELLMLFSDYSFIPPSIQAMQALYISLKKFNFHEKEEQIIILSSSNNNLKFSTLQVMEKINIVTNKKYPLKGSFNKYSTENKFNVAKHF